MASDDSGSAFAGLGQRGLVSRMHEQLDELLAARDQMEQLLRVIVEIGSDLDLDATLRRIILAARKLTSAPYGAWPYVIPTACCSRLSTRESTLTRCGASGICRLARGS